MIFRRRGSGINLRIVCCLKSYNKAIPIGFLAEEIGYTAPVVKKYLVGLQEKGIVRLNDDMVAYV
jgi:hypothetical protein